MQTISFQFFAAPASISTSAIPSDAKAILLYMLYRQGVPGWRFAMPNKPKFKSDAFAAIHSTAQGLYRAGAIDKTTMREFDESCLLAPTEIEPQRIMLIRENNPVSSVGRATALPLSDISTTNEDK